MVDSSVVSLADSSAGATTSLFCSTAVSSSAIEGAPTMVDSSVVSLAGSSAGATTSLGCSTAVSSTPCTSCDSEVVIEGTTPVVSPRVVSSESGDSSLTDSSFRNSAVCASSEVNAASCVDSSIGQATSKVSQALLSGSSDFKVKQ